MNTLRGTELYMSPVLFYGLKEDKDGISHNVFKSDVFSLGYCLIYVATLSFDCLYEIRDVYYMSLINSVVNKHLKVRYSAKFIELIGMMIEFDESKRLSFIELEKYIENNFD